MSAEAAAGLCQVLHNLFDLHRPRDRALRLLLALDIHDTWAFARSNPGKVSEGDNAGR